MLKVGELAKRSGVTVRTLHHYDAIGLLTPSARSDTGYRLYTRNDVARLHQIQALRRLGLSLPDIGTVLADPDSHLSSVVEQQLQVLDSQIAESVAWRDRLAQLQGQLSRGEEPAHGDGLTTLEMVTMLDRYLTKDEQKRFFMLITADNSTGAKWLDLVKSVREAMAMQVPPQSPEAQQLARRWVSMLVRDTHDDPQLLTKLHVMQFNEPSVQAQTGVTPELIAFIQQAFAETNFSIYEKYLSPAEFRTLRENYVKCASELPELIARARAHQEEGTAPDDPHRRQIAQHWVKLLFHSFVHSFAGIGPETHAKIREAKAKEPESVEGTWLDQRLIAYVTQAMSCLEPH